MKIKQSNKEYLNTSNNIIIKIKKRKEEKSYDLQRIIILFFNLNWIFNLFLDNLPSSSGQSQVSSSSFNFQIMSIGSDDCTGKLWRLGMSNIQMIVSIMLQ